MSTQLAEHAEMLLPYDAPRPVWLEARRTGIGGSDALACLGLDPWKTRLEVYLDKIGQAPDRETPRMRWGQIVEGAILDWFVEQTGIICQAEAELWQMVVDRTPPPLEGGRASEELVNRLYPQGKPGLRVDVDDHFMRLLRDYTAAHADYKAADERKKTLRAQLALLMGEATHAYYRGQLVATRDNRSKPTVEIQRLRDEQPLIAAEYITQTTYRVFTAKYKETA